MASDHPSAATPRGDVDDDTLSAAPHAAWWREWSKRGPQGPINDDADDQLPDDP